MESFLGEEMGDLLFLCNRNLFWSQSFLPMRLVKAMVKVAFF